MTFRRKITSFALAAMLTSGAVSLATLPAQAVGGNCSAVKQTEAKFGPDSHRARANCASLQGDSKARGTLVRNGGPDYHTSWFTTTGKYYYTGWYTCYAGCSARVQIEHV
ncbi:hypothetical protein [Ornithinimicrobium cerasi]|uniref:hypothetical protein n=1 Tax=Ornithinimicrobium cerasi TaxID=2248773 RepID=UPI00137A2E36|nr:hypothetical protein [Ornithinimicrobium cerasi]